MNESTTQMGEPDTQALSSWATTRPELNAGRFMRAFVRVNVYFYSKPPSKLSKTINKLGIKLNVFAYRRSQGRILGRFGDLEALLITTVGRKTGKERTVPLGYLFDRGRFIVVAVPGHFDIPGGPKAVDPAWYRNIQANPQASIHIGKEVIDVTAATATGADHDRYWEQFTTAYPFIGEFFKRADRPPPIVVLTPNDIADAENARRPERPTLSEVVAEAEAQKSRKVNRT
ncbi:deazaflavin-dependent oxidoreductase (nitroreductase family) [Haloactinopolyspora alba]|uniref:Deazaflavin-dependent oxidoreductase (Nitroreductase family) n=1 Tax=Haloactinopolyspora alba TaxID=648780 RepID=A0A2P8E932_9ACTN|nr:nitroreductase family deazaflavin-dependent oxidoreductase [Haloactinopolyspora alba]PSL05986.1 deazaflavin-dependent oxidoreductase (nitroreductase family) [Haloactinopolyspora alba]